MVYVLNKDGKPLMPTARLGNVRHLLKEQRAIIVSYQPFTIRLTYECPNRVQEVSLGVDAGSKHVGLSATTKKKVLFEAQLELRHDIVSKLGTRRENRHDRRCRKTRHRKNRHIQRGTHSVKGWIAPSVQQKLDSHKYWVDKIYHILPLTRIIVEIAKFDIQLLKAQDSQQPLPVGTAYQHGEQQGFWNVREYVLYRDGFKCQCCKGKSKDPILNVHHIQSRKVGGNAPNNLITLCKTCHTNHHTNPTFKLHIPSRGFVYKDATFMWYLRRQLVDKLKIKYGDMVTYTYGYVTKCIRILNGLPKEHTIDARCISGNPLAEKPNKVYQIRKIRCHNRQLHKQTFIRGGIRKPNQAPKEVFGFRLWDLVRYNGSLCFVRGRRVRGEFSISDMKGKVIDNSVRWKKLSLVHHFNSNIMF